MTNKPSHTAKVLALFLLCLLFTAPLAQAQMVKGEKTIGPMIGYASKNQSAYGGLYFQYAFSNHFRLAPDLGHVFRHKDLDAFVLDLNAHVPFGFTGEKAAFYPLAGFNYSSWSHHLAPDETSESDDVTTRTGRCGLNLGAGFDIRCSEHLKLTLEGKYCLMKGYTNTVLAIGISYVF